MALCEISNDSAVFSENVAEHQKRLVESMWTVLLMTVSIFLPRDFCAHADKYVCETQCGGWRWCELCNKCMHEELAVVKDEL